MNTKISHNLDTALSYAQNGWSVFPLKYQNIDGESQAWKHPLTKHGFKDATTNETQIREWWTKHPKANIGIATGKKSGLLVLDIDLKNGKNGQRTLDHLIEKYGPLGDALEVETGTGGKQLYFKYPSHVKIGNSAGKLGDGLDTRGEGGYVVAPGSINDDTGVEYRFINNIDISDPPTWLLGLLTNKKGKQNTVHTPTIYNGNGDRARKYCQSALNDAYQKIAHSTEGNRNDTLNEQTFSIAQLVGAGLIDETQARDSLVSAGLSAGLGEAETIKTVNSALEAGKKEPRSPESLPDFSTSKKAKPKTISKPPSFLLTETGLADRLVYFYGEDLKHNWGHGWLSWNKQRWQAGAEKQVQEHVKHIVKSLFDEAKDIENQISSLAQQQIDQKELKQDTTALEEQTKALERKMKNLLSYAMQVNKKHAIQAAICLANSDHVITSEADQFDRQPWVLNVQNGTIDLKTGNLNPHKREDMLTHMAGTHYDPKAQCPTWLRFLNDIMNNDKSMVDYLTALSWLFFDWKHSGTLFIHLLGKWKKRENRLQYNHSKSIWFILHRSFGRILNGSEKQKPKWGK